MQPERIFLAQICYKRSHGITVTYCIIFFFCVEKQRPKTNLEKSYECSVSIEISLDLKVCSSLVSGKINNLIALRLTNQITEITTP